MISTCFSRLSSRTRLQKPGLAMIAAVVLALSGLPAAADNYPPTDGEMQGFTLLKERVPAPSTPFQTGKGEAIEMSSFEGKVLIVNFWATWCAPCIKEMPSLDRLQAAFPGEDFEVVAINQDRGGKRIAEPFLREKLKLENLAIYLDAKLALGRAFKNRGLPATYAIDRNGNVVGGLFGPAEWDSEDAKALVRHLLAEDTSS